MPSDGIFLKRSEGISIYLGNFFKNGRLLGLNVDVCANHGEPILLTPCLTHSDHSQGQTRFQSISILVPDFWAITRPMEDKSC